MEKFEKYTIDKIDGLKQPTIYFWLKTNNFSEHYIKNLRNSNMIKLNGEIVNIRTKIHLEDVLEIALNPSKRTDIQLCEGKLDILYEDEDYLIVNKPHNLACTPTRSHFSNNLGGQICNYLKDENFTLRVVNRLDRETAGIVVIAKSVIACNNIKLEKEYHAICEGIIDKNFTINAPILTIQENGINQHKRIVDQVGKPSISHVFPIKQSNDTTLIKVILETGRTHQIRVHLSHIDHPLLGDTLYGSKSPSHTFLLLKKISFTHFRTNKEITLEVGYPKDWTSLL